MKNKIPKISYKKGQFNLHVNEDDRIIIEELFANNINVSGTFKMFIRKYLEELKQLNSSIKIIK